MPRIEALGRSSRRLKELRRRARSRNPGEVVVDGLRLMQDLLRWQVPVQELYLAEPVAASPGPVITALIDALAPAGRVWAVPEPALAQVAPTRHPQGVLAVVDEPKYPHWQATHGIALYLDQVQDPGNTGAIIRSAAALGAEAVLLSPGCADPFHPAAIRGSAGTALRLPLVRDAELTEVASRVTGVGGEVWAADISGVSIAAWRPRQPLLLVLGAEGAGLGPDARAVTEHRVTIPLGRQVESLNVAVAAALLLHQAASTPTKP